MVVKNNSRKTLHGNVSTSTGFRIMIKELIVKVKAMPTSKGYSSGPFPFSNMDVK